MVNVLSPRSQALLGNAYSRSSASTGDVAGKSGKEWSIWTSSAFAIHSLCVSEVEIWSWKRSSDVQVVRDC